MANSSQDADVLLGTSLDRGYVRVRFQQGKPVLDRELTLAADLASPRQIVGRYLGNGVVDDTGFQVFNLDVASGDFRIRAGRCLVDGLEIRLGADTSYQTQPNVGSIAPLPAGASFVYLRAFTREVSGTDDADLLNGSDVGFETARRDKADFEVVVSVAPITASNHFLLAEINTTTLTVGDRRRTGLSLATLRDEIGRSRGATAGLDLRLATSLDPTGALKAGCVGSTTLAASAVTESRVAALAVTEPKLANASISRRTVQPGTVTVQQLASTLVAEGSISVNPSTEAVVVFSAGATTDFFMARVRVTSIALIAQARLDWSLRARFQSTLFPPSSSQFHELVLKNSGTVICSATYKIYRILEA
ncbi:MAG TPA: hypothetical protein VJT73_01235 [Polyangiaceae bacterium]|nr:hypothetical protein [Polyangiaceae bacterium]